MSSLMAAFLRVVGGLRLRFRSGMDQPAAPVILAVSAP